MTLTLMSLEPDGTVYYSGLHQDIVIFRKERDSVESIETNGMWIGVMENIDGMNRVETIHLDPGDIMLLSTDGIVEATDSAGEMYGDEQLKTVLKSSGDGSPDSIKENIIKSLSTYTTDDDVTMVLVKRKSK